MTDAFNFTGELSCVLTLLVNFPLTKKYIKLVNTKYYFEWSTKYVQGSSTQIRVDAKGTTVFCLVRALTRKGDLSHQLSFKTFCQGNATETATSLATLCTLNLLKVSLSGIMTFHSRMSLMLGKRKVIGRTSIDLCEGLKIHTAPRQATSTTHFSKVTYCYLDEPGERFLYLKVNWFPWYVSLAARNSR